MSEGMEKKFRSISLEERGVKAPTSWALATLVQP